MKSFFVVLLCLLCTVLVNAREFNNEVDKSAFQTLASQSIDRFPTVLQTADDLVKMPRSDPSRTRMISDFQNSIYGVLQAINQMPAFEVGPQEHDPQAQFVWCLTFSYNFLWKYLESSKKGKNGEITRDDVVEKYECMKTQYHKLFPN